MIKEKIMRIETDDEIVDELELHISFYKILSVPSLTDTT